MKDREESRFGATLIIDPQRAASYQRFLEWAAGYDNNQTQGRNLYARQTWLKKLPCEVLEIQVDTSVEERIELVIEKLDDMRQRIY